MRTLLLILVCFSQWFVVHAQSACGTDLFFSNEETREFLPEDDIREIYLRARQNTHLTNRSSNRYYIPVVFHVLHDGENGNISKEQCQRAIEIINEDFNASNKDIANVRNTENAPFLRDTANFQIKFDLAKIDPSGNCTDGIQRRDIGNKSYNVNNEIKKHSSGGLDAWPREEYLNVWVVNSIAHGGGGVLEGYAQYPWDGAGLPENYGAVVRSDRIADIETGLGTRALTHEIGHCLGLRHTFNGGCLRRRCDEYGDFCCDTPPVEKAFFDCAKTRNSCGTAVGDGTNMNLLDQYENFMGYSYCRSMFTDDQKQIAEDFINSIDWLGNLVSYKNAQEKQILSDGSFCTLSIESGTTLTCPGETIQYMDKSFHGISEWHWTFEGGTPATSILRNPKVTYENPGVYDVTLTISDGSTSSEKTFTDYMTVIESEIDLLPYHESFEIIDSFPTPGRLFVENADNESTFEISSLVSSEGNRCLMLDNFDINNRSADALVSGSIDLSEVKPSDELTFSFDYAYKKRFSQNRENLRVYISNTCGRSWLLLRHFIDEELTNEQDNESFIPDNSDWREIKIRNIPNTYLVKNFQYKIEFNNDNGNIFYLDNIKIQLQSSLNVSNFKSDSPKWNIYPNPARNEFRVNLKSMPIEKCQITIINSLGQRVVQIYPDTFDFKVDVSNVPKGLYSFVLSTSDFSSVKNILIE